MKTQDLLQKYAVGKRSFQKIKFNNRYLSWQNLRAIDLSFADRSLSLVLASSTIDRNMKFTVSELTI